MTENLNPVLTRLKPFYPGQWGIAGSDSNLGLRNSPSASVFYVNNSAQSNDNNAGTDPEFPLRTITAANARCTNNRKDWVIVQGVDYNLQTFPITLTKSYMRVVSTFYDLGVGPEVRAPADTACFLISADNVELAGFEMGGAGATSGCIEFSTIAATTGVNIHHNRFGWTLGAQDGILMDGAVDKPHFKIHDNWFNNKLTRTGIYIEQNSTRSYIWNNTFRLGAGVRGINLATLCTDIYAITNNYFCTDGATQGSAITCNINSTGCLFEGNHAAWLGANPAQNPYLDLGTNHWGENFAGDVVIYPV